MKSAPDLVRTARRVPMLRRAGWPLYRYYRARTASGIAPPIMINSIPKAGTHLVASMLSKISGVSFSGDVITHHSLAAPSVIAQLEGQLPEYDKSQLFRKISKVQAGTFANCHLYYDEYTRSLLTSSNLSALFVVRDPRDIVVSSLTYMQQFPGHHFHKYLTSSFDTQTERLDALIFGWEPSAVGPCSCCLGPASRRTSMKGMADIGTRLQSFKGWSGTIPTFKFEDFTSAPDPESLDHSLHRLLEAAGLSDIADVDSLRRGVGDRWSATFNKAAAGGWRSVLSAKQAAAIESLASDYLTEYRYQ